MTSKASVVAVSMTRSVEIGVKDHAVAGTRHNPPIIGVRKKLCREDILSMTTVDIAENGTGVRISDNQMLIVRTGEDR